MSYYAVICLNGEELCVVHYNGYLRNQGLSLYNLVNQKFTKNIIFKHQQNHS